MSHKQLIPVLHVMDEEQVSSNLITLKASGLDKVFLIAHEGKYTDPEYLYDLIRLAKDRGFWVGANFLGCDPENELMRPQSINLDALWYDNSYAGLDDDRTELIFKTRNDCADNVQLFGGVAFKYCEQPKDIIAACKTAACFMDVVVTSGDGTGIAPDVAKIEQMKAAVGGSKLGIASGITPDNVANFDSADIYMVSTGISSSFYTFDADKIQKLVEKINL